MWPNPLFPSDLVKFTEEIFNEELHFSCSVSEWISWKSCLYYMLESLENTEVRIVNITVLANLLIKFIRVDALGTRIAFKVFKVAFERLWEMPIYIAIM